MHSLLTQMIRLQPKEIEQQTAHALTFAEPTVSRYRDGRVGIR